MKNYKIKSLFVALLGCTICLMFTLMYLGGFKSLTYFLGSEAIYDFPETDMIKMQKDGNIMKKKMDIILSRIMRLINIV